MKRTDNLLYNLLYKLVGKHRFVVRFECLVPPLYSTTNKKVQFLKFPPKNSKRIISLQFMNTFVGNFMYIKKKSP